MARVETWVGCDLDKAVQVRQLGGFLFTQDNEGNLLGAKVTQDGEPVNLTGTVVGYAILADGQTVDITGDSTGIQNGNEAYIILPQLAYSVPGQISIVIKLTTADTITTLAAFCGYVYRSKTGNEVVPPGTPIPDLSTLEEAIRNANTAATAANTAAAAAENVDISMSQDGDVITITTTDRHGETETATLTDQSEAVSELKSAIDSNNAAETDLLIVGGKNLFNPLWFIQNGIEYTDGVFSGKKYDYLPITIPFAGEAGKRYTLSFKAKTDSSGTGTGWTVRMLDDRPGNVQVYLPNNTTEWTEFHVTSRQLVSFTGITFYNVDINNDMWYFKDVQLEVGESASTYTAPIITGVDSEARTGLQSLLSSFNAFTSLALHDSRSNFSTYGDANALPINQSFVIHPSDYSESSHLPAQFANESAGVDAVISTITGSSSRGMQIIVANEHIYSRVVKVDTSAVTEALTAWIVIKDNQNVAQYVTQTFTNAGGDANRLPVNTIYSTDSRYVVSGSHLPDELANYAQSDPFFIVTATCSSSRGYQFIVASGSFYFRTITYNYATKIITTNTAFWKKVTLDTELVDVINAIRFPYPYPDYETFYSDVNGAFLAKALVTDRIVANPSGVYGVHESNIYVYNNKIYLVYAANKTDYTEDHAKYNFELTRLALDGTVEDTKKIVATGDTIGGVTITGCQAPFILPAGDTIHIYCDVHIGGTTLKMYHVAYDITNDSFGSFSAVSFVDVDGETKAAEMPNEQFICPKWFEYSTHSYCTALSFNADNTGIGYTDDFTTFEFIARVDAPLIGSGREITAIYVSSFSKFVIAYRTQNAYSYLIMRQYDIAHSKWENELLVPDATARPMFFEFDSGYYLANNAPFSRKNVTVWKYLISSDGTWSNMGVLKPMDVAKLTTACIYFSFCVYNGEIYMASIQDNLQKIAISKIEIESVSDSEINTALFSMFSS